MGTFNINDLITYGVMDYYLDLVRFINNYVNKHYPLTNNDFKALICNETSEIINLREQTANRMYEALRRIIDEKISSNQIFVESLLQGKVVESETMDKYKENLELYQKELIESLNNIVKK